MVGVPEQREVSGVEAVFLGAASVALSNAVRIARLELPDGGLPVRAHHLAVELGHTLLLATAVAAAVGAWARWGPKRPWLAIFLAFALAGVAAEVVLVEDTKGPLEQLGGDPESPLELRALCLLPALSVPFAFVVGRLLARTRLRFVAVVLGTALVLVNPHLLEGGYSGVHFFLAATGATLFGASLVGALRPVLVRRAPPRWLVFGALSLALLAGVSSVVVPTSSLVEVELERLDSAVLYPWLGHRERSRENIDVPVPDEMKPWFEKRKKKRPIPPTQKRLLPDGPIVILFTIDAFRYDLMKRYREVAPNVQAIREKSIYFSQARSFGAGTRISLSALFSGRYYSMLKWTRPLSTRPTLERDTLPRFPDLLQKAGIPTLNVISLQEMLTEEIGVVHGFSEEIRSRKGKGEEQKLSADVTEQAIERLRKQGSGPLFLFMHVIDPHEPYRTYGKHVDSKREAYNTEVTLSDASLGKLHQAVQDFGLSHRTAFIVSSDHGEGFGENGVYYHNRTVYDVMVHVPLMIEIPGLEPRTLDHYVSVMDVGPTILDLFGVETPGFWMARSLVPDLLGEPPPKGRPLVMETRFEHGMLFPDGFKAILKWQRGTEEIYDMKNDPAERKNLRDRLEDGDQRMSLLRKYFAIHAGKRQNGERF